MDVLSLILKVFGLSLGLAIAIKYGAPYLNVPAISSVALVAVLLPTLVMGALLGWRLNRGGL